MEEYKRKQVSTDRVQRNIEQEQEKLNHQLKTNPWDIPRVVVYNDIVSTEIRNDITLNQKTCSQADSLFETKIKQSDVFKKYKIPKKRIYWRYVFQAIKKALYFNGCIRYTRNYASKEFSKIRIQVIDCAIQQNLVHEVRSKPGSPKTSRLLVMPELYKFEETDPWAFDECTEKQFVHLYKREDENKKNRKDMIDLDTIKRLPEKHVAHEMQERLEIINSVNSHCEILYEEQPNIIRKLRPIHYSIFTDNWELHGRIYTGEYGHQSLSKKARSSITFDGYRSVELDYCGMHTRMLYHLKDIEFNGDPYALWGIDTTLSHRLLAKRTINIAINAKNRKGAISACNKATCAYTDDKDDNNNRIRKTGKELEKAIKLLNAKRETSLEFKVVYDLAREYHTPIGEYFGNDFGIKLMRMDSSIAINIMYSLAQKDIPCLCCHDSFIVPVQYRPDLQALMNKWYYEKLKYYPEIN